MKKLLAHVKVCHGFADILHIIANVFDGASVSLQLPVNGGSAGGRFRLQRGHGGSDGRVDAVPSLQLTRQRRHVSLHTLHLQLQLTEMLIRVHDERLQRRKRCTGWRRMMR